MQPTPAPRLLALALLAASSVSAADTLTVGPTGSGADFSTMAAAVAASQPHDTVLVFPGVYTGAFATFHPLRIVGLGDPLVSAGGVSVAYFGSSPAYAPGDATVLAGLRFNSDAELFKSEPLAVASKAPLVAVGCTLDGVSLEGPAQVVFDSCSITELRASGVDLYLNRCEVQGKSVPAGSGGKVTDEHGTVAASLIDCTTSITRSSIVGGDGKDQDPFVSLAPKGADALRVYGGTAVIRGGPGALVQGGDGDHESLPVAIDWPGGHAISTAHGGHVTVQSDVPVTGGADGTAGTHAAVLDPTAVAYVATVYPTAAVLAAPVDLGGSTTLSITGAPGALWLGISSAPHAPAAVAGVEGALHLDPATLIVIPLALPPAGALELPIVLPPDPSLSGLDFAAQVLTEDGGTAALSDPTFLVVGS